MSAQLIFDIEKLEKENEALRRQLASTQKQFGICDVCGYAAWRDKGKDVELCVVCDLQKQLAARDEALGGAIEAYDLITGWVGVECECGHPACKRCRHTKEARKYIAAARAVLKGTV